MAFVVITVVEANSEFQKKQKVLIKHADKKTFIQTDKPVYKPGQIGMDRMPLSCERESGPQGTKGGVLSSPLSRTCSGREMGHRLLSRL